MHADQVVLCLERRPFSVVARRSGQRLRLAWEAGVAGKHCAEPAAPLL